MSSIGGLGFPQPPISQDPNVNFARGVDLSALKDKRKHTHRWVVVGKFALPDKILAKMAENVLKLENAEKAGKEMEVPPVPIPMGDGNMLSLDGPGCAKCGSHWSNAYGQLCPVSDDTQIPEAIAFMDHVNNSVIPMPE